MDLYKKAFMNYPAFSFVSKQCSVCKVIGISSFCHSGTWLILIDVHAKGVGDPINARRWFELSSWPYWGWKKYKSINLFIHNVTLKFSEQWRPLKVYSILCSCTSSFASSPVTEATKRSFDSYTLHGTGNGKSTGTGKQGSRCAIHWPLVPLPVLVSVSV